MAFPLPTVIPLGSKSRVSHPSIYAGFDELNNHNDSGDRGGYNYHDLWVRIKQMVWGQHNPYLNIVRRDSGFRFGIQHDNSWKRLYARNSDKSSQSGTRSNKHRKRNRYFVYYGIIISILAIGTQVMLKREKPTILQTLWRQLQETLQIKPSNSRIMEPLRVRSSDRT